MLLRRIGLTALLLLGLAHAAAAQQPAPVPSTTTAAVDVNRLPLDLNRINRRLQKTTEREVRDGLRLRYSIDVYGQAPRIDVLDPTRDNLRRGPVPYGGPTHQEMLQIMTPQEFRAPVADFSALMRWIQDRSKK